MTGLYIYTILLIAGLGLTCVCLGWVLCKEEYENEEKNKKLDIPNFVLRKEEQK